MIIALLLLAATGGLWWYFSARAGQTKLAAMFSESVGIYPGSDVRILGVPVGAVDGVTPEGTEVKVTMHLDSGVSVRADTHAVVIAPSLVSDRYVQLTGVYDSGPKLADGATIPHLAHGHLGRDRRAEHRNRQAHPGARARTVRTRPATSPTCSTSARRTCAATARR